MKTFNWITAIAAVSVLTLSGCGTTNTSQTGTSNPVVNTSTLSTSSTAASDIKGGVTKMLSIANELKTEISSGDDAKIKETGPKLEDIWRSFEDSVKPKYPDSYAKVEQYLDPAVAGSKAATPDKQALSKLNDQLIQALNDLLAKVNQ